MRSSYGNIADHDRPVGFDHFQWVGGSGGLFLPVTSYSQSDVLNLRGKPVMFYYLILALTVLAFIGR